MYLCKPVRDICNNKYLDEREAEAPQDCEDLANQCILPMMKIILMYINDLTIGDS